MRWAAITVALLVGFGVGMAAQRGSGINMRGTVMDGNTIAEPIEYWEVRAGSGESVVITGRWELPVIQWLRQAKGRPVLVSIELAGPPSASRELVEPNGPPDLVSRARPGCYTRSGS